MTALTKAVTGVAGAAALILRLALALGLAGLVATVAIQVTGRYLLAHTPVWSEVLSGVILVWITFLAAALAVRDDENLAIALLPDSLRGAARIAIALVIAFATALFVAVLIEASVDQLQISSRSKILGLGVSSVWLYASAPVGGVFTLIFLVERALLELAGRGPRPEPESSPA